MNYYYTDYYPYAYTPDNSRKTEVINGDIIKVIQNCQTVCYQMSNKCLQKPDVTERRIQIALLGDCAESCLSTTIFLAKVSQFIKDMLNICASICEECGNECLKFNDTDSQICASVCLNCAKLSRQFISAHL